LRSKLAQLPGEVNTHATAPLGHGQLPVAHDELVDGDTGELIQAGVGGLGEFLHVHNVHGLALAFAETLYEFGEGQDDGVGDGSLQQVVGDFVVLIHPDGAVKSPVMDHSRFLLRFVCWPLLSLKRC
jgi:hypothetical protein